MTPTAPVATQPLAIQFSHGNGFPAGTYTRFLSALAPQYEVHALERIGHDGRFPITDGWPHLVEELIAQLDAAPVPRVLVGHSLGGILSLQAAYARPDRVRAVIMLDSPIFSRYKALLFQFAKRTGLDERFSPAGITKNRRNLWPSRRDAMAHFVGKPLFRDFDTDVLSDYIEHGMVEDESGSGVRLSFLREHEYRIYRTVPHHLYRLTDRPPAVPVGFIAGTRSAELKLVGAADSLRFARAYFRWFEGSHLFPMERPHEAAQVVKDLLTTMGVNSPSP